MSRYIDADELYDRIKYSEDALEPSCRWTTQGILSEIEDAPTVKAIPKDQYEKLFKDGFLKDCEVCVEHFKENYENRLKVDLKAILTEIQLEIEDESWTRECLDGSDETIVDMKSVNEVFQQKINALKEKEDEP